MQWRLPFEELEKVVIYGPEDLAEVAADQVRLFSDVEDLRSTLGHSSRTARGRTARDFPFPNALMHQSMSQMDGTPSQ